MFDKAYLRRVAMYIGATVVALAVAFLIGYHLWMNVTSEIETIPAVPEVFFVTAEYDAWVFRDETVVPTAANGTVVPAVKNGEKIAKSDLVASIYSSVPSEKLSELSTIRSQIRLLEGKSSSVISGDLGIGEVMASLSSSVKNNDLSFAREISSRLTALVAARAAGGGDTETVTAALKEKAQALISSFGTPLASVYSPCSGWYYGNTDGFESVFTTDAVAGITPEGLDSLLSSEPVFQDSAGKIVNTYTWYIAASMSAADGNSFYEGKKTEIRIPGVTDPLKLNVESVSGGSDGRVAVVFSCGTIPDNVTIDRHLSLDFTLREVEGFGIPKDAVRVLDDQIGVFTYNGVMVKFKKINIIEELDDMYIAEIRKEEETEAPVTTGDSTSGETDDASPVGEGTGRKDYLWLDINEFIVVKGKALRSGKVIG